MPAILPRPFGRLSDAHSAHPALIGRLCLALLALIPFGAAFYGLSLGQDGNWDLRNYHWYNAYAFFHERALSKDIAPAQVASFYNPLLDLPVYLLAQGVSAKGVSFALGWLHGLNIIPLFGIAWLILKGLPLAQRWPGAVGLALGGFLGAGQLSLIATVFHDNLISLPVFTGLWLAMARGEELWRGKAKKAFAVVVLAGFLTGAAVGLKQPTLPYAVGLCFGFFFAGGTFWRRFGLSFFFGLGVLLGMGLCSGYWALHLWTVYGNPLFPYFNHVFQSPWGVPEAYRDDKFIPQGLFATIFFPFLWSFDAKKVGEIVFFDLRIPIAYGLFLLTPALLWLRRRGAVRHPALTIVPANDDLAPAYGMEPGARRYALASVVIAYIVWLKLFSIYRYLIPLEMLAPLMTVALIRGWPLPRMLRSYVVISTLLLAFLTSQPGTWARIPFGDRFVEVKAPDLPNPDHTLILQTGYAPTSFLIVGFPPAIPFLRIHSYFIHPDHGDIELNKRMRQAIETHDGDFYMLVAPWELWTQQHILPYYRLVPVDTPCLPVTSNLDEPMLLCKLTKIAPSAMP
jgi:hypothetical protein